MRIIYFFTFDYSLKTLENSGSLDREIQYFKYLNQHFGYSFLLVTYGDESEKNSLSEYDFIEILPIYSLCNKNKYKFTRYLSSFLYPFKLKNFTKDFDLIKQNQLLGSWVSIIFKLITKKKLFIRTGYDMYTFSKKENKPAYLIFLYYFLTKFSLIFADLYSVSNNQDKNLLSKINKKKHIQLIPNWVENLNFLEFNSRDNNKILCVGRLEHQKNYSYLLNSLSNTNIEIDIYGDGSLLDELKDLSSKLNVKANFHGTLKYKDLKNIYQQYKIFVSTSLFEGNPKSTLEAMSAGCVPVVSQISNNAEIIQNNETGILFSFEDDLGNLLNKLFSKTDYLAKISSESHERIIQSNNINVIANIENKLIQDL